MPQRDGSVVSAQSRRLRRDGSVVSELPPIALTAAVPSIVIVRAVALARRMSTAPLIVSTLLRGAVLRSALLLVEVAPALVRPLLALVTPLLLGTAELLGTALLFVATPLLCAALLGAALTFGLMAPALFVPALFRAPLGAHVVAA